METSNAKMKMFPKVLVLPEFSNGILTSAAQLLLNFANENATSIDMLAINCDLPSALSIGVSKVYVLASSAPANIRAASTGVAMLVSALSGRYDAILVARSSPYHVALCKASAVLNKVVITNVFEIAPSGDFLRTTPSGLLIQQVRYLAGPPCLLSVNVNATKCKPFQPLPQAKSLQIVHFDAISLARFNVLSCFRRKSAAYQGCLPLAEASFVVAGGASFKSARLFERYLIPLARRFKGAVGASRSAVEAGFAPPTCQIGQTGAIISPKLYFAFGISGAIQHMAGVSGSNLIFAVNCDAKAPIIKRSDVSLIANMFEALTKLNAS
ncbi:MAG: electron transfer flavoprotein subunit alpha/FixB family protein [Candidatus Hodgkinia cicadicola]